MHNLMTDFFGKYCNVDISKENKVTYLKVHLRVRQFLMTESPLRIMKNAFYFTLKAFLVLKIFRFLSWLLRSYIQTA